MKWNFIIQDLASIDSGDLYELCDLREPHPFVNYKMFEPAMSYNGEITTLYETFHARSLVENGYGMTYTHMEPDFYRPGYITPSMACYGVPLIHSTMDEAMAFLNMFKYRYSKHIMHKIVTAAKAWELARVYTEVLTGRRIVTKVVGALGTISYQEIGIDETKFTHQQAIEFCLQHCKRNKDKIMEAALSKAASMYKKPEPPSELSDEAIERRSKRKGFLVFEEI